MDPVAQRAAEILSHHPAPAVRLSALAELLREARPRFPLTPEALRRTLVRYPEVFRLLDPWRGPWSRTTDAAPRERPEGEPWVVVVADPGARDEPTEAGIERLRESVRWLAGLADPRSPRDVSRAHRIVLGEHEAREALRPAA